MSDTTGYSISRTVKLPFDRAVERAREELQKEGFGILSEIDVKATMKKKLDLDFRPYLILGACNPPLAHKALSAELEIGLLLPCNVVVWETSPGECVVSAIDPDMMVEVVKNRAAMQEVATVVKEKLTRVIAGIA